MANPFARLAAGSAIACCLSLIVAAPVAACPAGGSGESWPDRLTIEIAAEGTVIEPADGYGVFRIRLDRLYRGHLEHTFRLDTGGGCFVDQELMTAGQRIFFVHVGGNRSPVSVGDVWFLDSSGQVTEWGSAMFDDHSRNYRTLDDLLEAMGLMPDTSMEPGRDPSVLGLLLVSMAVMVYIRRTVRPAQ